jgi:alkylation response protein AidB-like acyl-CoA dehydrogenase
VYLEEYARADAPYLSVNFVGMMHAGPTLIAEGNDEQRAAHLPAILRGEQVWCQGFSEPTAGSDLASMRTRAVRDGDHYVVNGQKVWSSQAYNADYAILLARTDTTVPKHKGISYFILDMHAPGVEVRRLKQITGSAEFCEEFLTNVKVPVENRIGDEGEGWVLAQTTLGFERGGSLLARATRHKMVLNRLIEVCQTMPRNGGVAIDDPLVRQKIGKMMVETEVLRYAALRLLSNLQKGKRPGPESSVDKLYYSEMDKRHQEMILEILGPYGQMFEGLPEELSLDLEATRDGEDSWAHNFLWSRAGTIYSGSSEIQKNIIGERVLKLPREVRADRLARV